MGTLSRPSASVPGSFKKIRRVLIANRGEISLRIARTLRMLDLESVAIYSDADASSRHRFFADYAYRLPGFQSRDTYLRIDSIIKAAKESGAQAVHPGYGFLSENAEFAAAIVDAGLIFIGPSSHAIRSMGDKIQAKALMRAAKVPVTPGSEQACETLADLEKAVRDIGLPIILKAAAGGGGRGMQVVRQSEDLVAKFEQCQREALAYFNNAAVFCERYIEHPRHIEIQVLRDSHGNCVHLFERDCTVQRRHQKLIEEAPSTYLSPQMREKLGVWAIQAAESVKYTGAGTVEFICASPEEAYFMEMNTRIQVEHPVTEMITGVDLIAEQLRIAEGLPLSIKQQNLKIHGHALEVRINAEDPAKNFQPSPGCIHRLQLPQGPFCRVDTHIYEGYEIPEYYDSMIAKFISWGVDRDEAIARMRSMLSEFHCLGIDTTAPYHESVLQNARFLAGNYSTRFVEEEALTGLTDAPPPPEPSLALLELMRNSHPMPSDSELGTWSNVARLESQHRMV